MDRKNQIRWQEREKNRLLEIADLERELTEAKDQQSSEAEKMTLPEWFEYTDIAKSPYRAAIERLLYLELHDVSGNLFAEMEAR